MDNKDYWDNVYNNKSSDKVSWYQEHASPSLKIIAQLQLSPHAPIIDIGGGASTLVDDLLAQGFSQLQVLDVSAAALEIAQKRLGERAEQVDWLVSDITDCSLAENNLMLWHDRAVFHFLTEPQDQQSYIESLSKALQKGGYLLIATFAIDGPTQCSGLNIQQHSADSLQTLLGGDFELLEQLTELHKTPFSTQQKFIYCLFRKC